MDFKNAKELLNLCSHNHIKISEVMKQRESILGEVSVESIQSRM